MPKACTYIKGHYDVSSREKAVYLYLPAAHIDFIEAGVDLVCTTLYARGRGLFIQRAPAPARTTDDGDDGDAQLF